jgi:hypothetical protein
MDASLFDEGALGCGDELAKKRCKSQGKNFCNDLGDYVNQTYRSEIADVFSPLLLG